jgi:hypothetical protein
VVPLDAVDELFGYCQTYTVRSSDTTIFDEPIDIKVGIKFTVFESTNAPIELRNCN